MPSPCPLCSCLADPRCIYHSGRKADEINLFKSVLQTVGAGKKRKILATALSKSFLFGYLLPWFHTQGWFHVIWVKMQGSSRSKATKTKQRTQHLTFSSHCFVESCLGLFHSLKGWWLIACAYFNIPRQYISKIYLKQKVFLVIATPYWAFARAKSFTCIISFGCL